MIPRRTRWRAASAAAICCAIVSSAGCGEDEAEDGAATGRCPTPSGVPGEIMDLSATSCEEAGEIAVGYFSDGAVPNLWTCTPLPSKMEAVECFQGGCEPPPDVDSGKAQSEPAPFFLVELDEGTSEDAYKHVRECEPL